MSDLLNSASLVMIPSGYKEDVVYSQIPTDGSGDLAFTRASNGTRVNSAGLVEVCPWNLVEQSETFENASWLKFDASATANATTAPNGTTTADKFVEGTGSSIHRFNQGLSIESGQSYTFSVYAKASERTRILLRTNNGSADQDTYFDLTNGTIISGTGTIESVGDGWYKVSRSLTATTSVSSNFITQLLLVNTGTNTSYTGNGTSGLFVWGAQLNIGSTAKPYFPTTDRLNVPRLTYQNGGGGCPSLLLEKQSTNLSAQSQDFNGWANKVNITTTANYATSPDGTQNASRLQFTANGFMYGNTGFGQTSGTVYTLSCWAKRNGSGSQSVGFFIDGSGGVNSAWSLSSEYQRFTYTFTAGNNSTVGIAGASGADVSVWGWQFEASSYATSYIPTTSSSATRVADFATKTGISSLIGSTEGVLFAEVNYQIITQSGTVLLDVNDGDLINRVVLLMGAGVVGGFVQGTTLMTYSLPSFGKYKIAFAYKSGDFVLYVNGVQQGTSSSSITFSGMSQLFVGHTFNLNNTQPVNGISQAVLFKTRLTNAELASLTTL